MRPSPLYLTTGIKKCRDCGEVKELGDFPQVERKGRWLAQSYCKPCQGVRNRDWCRVNKETRARQRRDRTLQDKYGLTLAEYEAWVERLAGCCEGCGVKPTRALAVDHCHSTGVVRGLLCTLCNLTAGVAKDDPARLRGIATYLERKAA